MRQDSAPAIVSSIPPSNALAAFMMFLFYYQLVYELLTPSFARNICYARRSEIILPELVIVTNLVLRDVLVKVKGSIKIIESSA